MIREPKRPILTKEDVKPTKEFLRVDGIFNCGVTKYKGEYLLLCRVAESCPEGDEPSPSGLGVNIPVFDENSHALCLKHINGETLKGYDVNDSRTIAVVNADGRRSVVNLTSISSLRLAHSTDGIHFTVEDEPIVPFEGVYESWGMEDPRITYLEEENRYVISYTAVSQYGVMPALLVTEDFESYERLGIILPPENKDAVLFPRKVNGRYYLCHRPVPTDIGKPDIWMASSADLINWGGHRRVCGAQKQQYGDIPEGEGWESAKIGSGAPPIYTEKGWLHVYHGVDASQRYCLGVMLTDLAEPWRVLARSRVPLLEPEEPYEKEGFFGEVVFTCGCLVENDNLIIYYGAADDKIARAKVPMEEVWTLLER